MKRLIAVAGSSALMLSALLIAPAPASAAITWDFSGGSFTLNDGQGGTGTVTIQSLHVTGAAASGRIGLSNGGRSSCSTQTFSGLQAVFSLDGAFNPCSGWVSFSISPTGVLTVVGGSVYIPSTLLSGPAREAVPGTAQPPVVAQLSGCTASVNDPSQTLVFGLLAGNPDAATYELVIAGTSLPVESVTPGTEVQVPYEYLTPGSSYTATIMARRAGDNAVVATCVTPSVSVPPLGKPTIDSLVPATGGLLSVNYSVVSPGTVQGIEYMVDAGSWTRPGGVAPVNGAGGAFTLSGLAAGKHTVTLRSIGFGPTALSTEGDPKSATVPAATTGRPSNAGSPTAVGSSPSQPVAAPPATPVSAVSGTSNGAGSGANGALAATTGDAGIDAPCLAPNGTLYPTQYSTVGSQLTMAPNTRGLGKATSFTVVGGALPPGMQLDRTYGVLFGVTTQPGSWVTVIRARFANGPARTSQFTTRVDADSQTLQYAAQNIGSVGRGIAIGATSNAPVNGTSYRLVCGRLPSGTRLEASTGRIVGKPTRVVSLPTPLRVAETSASGSAAASFIFVVNISGASSFSYPAHPHVRVGKRVSIRPTVSGVGDVAIFRTSKGKLPKGLHVNHRTGVISGRITHVGRTHTITLVAVTRGGALLTAAPMRLSLRR